MKVILGISGDKVVFTQTVPDNTKVITVPLDTPVAPVPTTLIPELPSTPREPYQSPQAPAEHEPERPPVNSRNGFGWKASDLRLAQDRTLSDSEVGLRTGRSESAIRDYRRKNGLSIRPVRRRSSRGRVFKWTDQEESLLLELAGLEARISDHHYQELVEQFPRHPSAAALHNKHVRLIEELNL